MVSMLQIFLKEKKNSCETLQILVNKSIAYCTATVVLRLTGVTFLEIKEKFKYMLFKLYF